MKKLLSGLRQFQENYIPSRKALLKKLAKGQNPRVLFIACSDSRVDPALITQADIGDLFVIRNAGNIVPPYEATNGGEGATIEYAIEALDIKQIIVCGHTHCGAMKGLLQVGELEDKMPLVYNWLRHTAATRKLVQDNYSHLDKEEMLAALEAENVLTQIENLRTYPVIRSKLYQEDLSIHAWLYKIETGEVLAYDSEEHAFMPPHSKIYPEPDIQTQPALVGNGSTHASPAIAPPVSIPVKQAVTQSQKTERMEPTQFPGSSRLSREQAERIYRGSAAQPR